MDGVYKIHIQFIFSLAARSDLKVTDATVTTKPSFDYFVCCRLGPIIVSGLHRALQMT